MKAASTWTKTRFLRPLEDERFVFLIRPRGFGKSCWLSLLENYYDRKWASEFEQVFGTLDIGREPTENRHSFVTLRFDFSAVRDAPETLEREFEDYCGEVIRRSMERHPALFPQQEVQHISSAPSTEAKLHGLFWHAAEHDIRLYVLIDEYDNFANTILAHHGANAYHELKYLKRGENAGEDKVQAVAEEAEEQLRRYLADERLGRAYPTVKFTGLAVVFHGWEMARCENAA